MSNFVAMDRSVDNKMVHDLISHAMESNSGFSAADTDDIGINDIHSYRLAIAKTIMDYKLSTNATALLFQTAMSVKSKDRIMKELTNRDVFKSNPVAVELLRFINDKVVMATSDQTSGKISMLKIPESFPEICFFIYVYQHRHCSAIDVCTKSWMASANLVGVSRYINFMANWNLWGVEIQVSKIQKAAKNFKRGFDLKIYCQSMADGIPLSAFGSIFSVKTPGYDLAEIDSMIKFIHNMTDGINMTKVANKLIEAASTTSVTDESSTPTSSKPEKMVFCKFSTYQDLVSGAKEIKDVGYFLTVGNFQTSTVQDNHYQGLTAEIEAMTDDEKKTFNKKKSDARKEYERLELAAIMTEAFQSVFKTDTAATKSSKEISIKGVSASDFEDATKLSLTETNIFAITDKAIQDKCISVKSSIEAIRKKLKSTEIEDVDDKKEVTKAVGENSKAPVLSPEKTSKTSAENMEDALSSIAFDKYDGKSGIERSIFLSLGLTATESATVPKVLICSADESSKITSTMTDSDIETYEEDTKTIIKKINGLKEMIGDIKEPMEKTKTAASFLKEITNRDIRIRLKKVSNKK